MGITVTALSTTPVKGTRIQEVESVVLDERGARGDRAFYVIDADGALVNGKRLGTLQTIVAEHDPDGGTLALRFPDGGEASGPVRLGTAIATRFLSRRREARVLDGPWASALSAYAGEPLRLVATELGVDRGREGAASLISRASLRRLAEAEVPSGARGGAAAQDRIDGRRFRMLIEIDGVGAHEEDRWIGREVRVGQARLRFHGNIGRCVTTTRDPESGAVDLPTLKMLAGYRRNGLETTEPLPFGIHGEVLAGGTVALGDPVTVDG